ncbi:hypothetical protein [Mesorhizobium sp. BE184]|uniref:hypothetical protein n=1 Tax=Mesorhizobium sp. BE184 TaxID=2817714 RepID=UPI00285799FD|nr:hypothetical protein [Mesorhizobium sp. BE184]MDR7032947.1 hypothetical protein [Mesorhizobium sp. BE184]
MEAKQASRYDLTKLFERPAKRMKVEYRNAGSSVAEARKYFLGLLNRQQVVAFREGERALAVLGWDDSDGVMDTSFVAVEEYFDVRYVRFLRRYVRQFQSERGGLEITSNSFSEDPRTPKWFKMLGFQLSTTDGVHRIYVLPATA